MTATAQSDTFHKHLGQGKLCVPKAHAIMQNTDDQRREQSADELNRVAEARNWAIQCEAKRDIVDIVCSFCALGVEPSFEDLIARAAGSGRLNVVRYLCELPRDKVNPHAGLCPAASAGQLEVVRYLCELPRDRGVNPHVGLCPAASTGKLEVVRYLCELPRDRGVNPHVGLCPAASAGQLEVVRYLCELPPDRLFPKATDASAASDCPIHAAAIKGHQDVVRYLCGVQAADGASAATPGRVGEGNALPCGDGSAGRLPPEGRHANVVRYLCELPAYRGLDPSCDGGSPAGLAARLDGRGNPLDFRRDGHHLRSMARYMQRAYRGVRVCPPCCILADPVHGDLATIAAAVDLCSRPSASCTSSTH